MVSSSKILTVSYGTFSCTAEGFEDPLAVMKDTTHFFRSVVGEDRFFGAEPPQFDPELASELMREQLASHQGGQVRLDLPGASVGKATAASSGALAAALAAGPTRAKAEEHALPDDDTIEATAYEPEVEHLEVSEPVSEELTTKRDAVEDAPAASDETLIADTTQETDDLDLDALLVEDADQAADLAEPVGNAPAPRPTGAASVAAKLDRIRAVVADNDASGALAEDENDDDALSALLANATAQADHSVDSAADVSDDVVETVEDAAELVDDNLFTDTTAGLMQADVKGQSADLDDLEASEDITPEPEPNLDQVLETAFDEDEGEFDLVAALDQVDKAESEQALVEDDDPLAAWDDDVEEDDADHGHSDILGGDIAAAVAGLTDTAFDDEEDDALFDDESVEELMAEPALEPVIDADPEPELAPAPRRVRARVVKVKRSDFDRAVQSGQLEEVVEEASAVPTPPAAPVETPPATPMASSSSLSDEEEDELARELAAVKAELADEMAGWDDEDIVDTPATNDAPAPSAEADDWGWDDEDEDDLVAATSDDAPLRLDNPVAPADLEIDLTAAIDGARKAVKMASPARAMLTEQSVEDNDTSRILDQTNTELEEPEGNRRRSAIAHLRAAVAATKADRLLGRKPTADEETEPYREDLANVVRPRRPQAGGARTERPSVEPQRAAPLKLVAEQRVEDSADTAEAPAPVQVTPVRPRRVSRSAPAAAAPQRSERPQENVAPAPLAQPSGDSDFAAYAESVGAQELPDLLEAAAAYMSYVEGLDQFSRPQLMTTVRQAEAQESSREDRLRSFGQLLRDGKIEKTSGGRFTASDRISFKPSRAVG